VGNDRDALDAVHGVVPVGPGPASRWRRGLLRCSIERLQQHGVAVGLEEALLRFRCDRLTESIYMAVCHALRLSLVATTATYL
jgi:hypothetical protein